jgi:nucleotide-binding universal stress UspA family protein
LRTMSGIQRILCPTDFSEFSRRALEYAVVLAERFRADLVALYVLSGAEPLVDGEPPWRTVTERDARLRESFLEKLRHFVERAKLAGVPARIALREGRAVDGILSEAGEWPADLIVLGTHGASGFERLALGSVTEKVLRKACIPVLAVPREPEGAPAENLLRRPLCPVDFSPS